MISFRFFVGIQVWAPLIPEPWKDNRVIVSITFQIQQKGTFIVSGKQHKLFSLSEPKRKQSESELCRCCGSKFSVLR